MYTFRLLFYNILSIISYPQKLRSAARRAHYFRPSAQRDYAGLLLRRLLRSAQTTEKKLRSAARITRHRQPGAARHKFDDYAIPRHKKLRSPARRTRRKPVSADLIHQNTTLIATPYLDTKNSYSLSTNYNEPPLSTEYCEPFSCTMYLEQYLSTNHSIMLIYYEMMTKKQFF